MNYLMAHYHKFIWIQTFILLTLPILGQDGYNNHWHFGNGIGVDFSNGTPVNSTSNGQTPLNAEPAVLSDPMGNLLAYTDGNDVYNNLGELIENGDFSGIALESIFAPIPGEMNKFYLFRSSSSLGVSWSIIDLSAMSGQGAILQEEKDVNFHPSNSELMVTSHANQTDFWLVIADNEDGNSGNELNLNTFEITNEGFNNVSSYSGQFIFATWDPYVDDARMSPDCSRIATIHKGHYSTLFEFDNASGAIITGFANSVDVQSSFGTQDFIEFSESGEYLYVLKDNSSVYRFDATALNEIDFGSSNMQVETPFGDWNHIKRGPDGNIYLLNENENTLDVIYNSEGESPEYEAGVLVLEGENAKFFPNTMNSCQGVTYINVNDVCISDSTFFLASTAVNPDSLYWVINGDGISDTIFSITTFSQYFDEPNEFAVSFNYLFDDLWYVLEDSTIVYAQPTVDLGEDIVACEGDNVQLSVGETPYDLIWNTGSMDYNISPIFSGTYSVTIVNGTCDVNDDVDVFFIQEPIVNIEDVVICNEQVDVTLDATGTWIDNYIWQDGSSDSTLVVSESGHYSVMLSNECFTVDEQAQVTYIFFPESLVDEEFTLCGVDTINMESAYQEGNISWSNTDEGPFTAIVEDGSYSIQIEQLGCFIFDSFDVIQIPYVDANDLLIPNVITVNGDEINDTFRPFAYYNKTENICNYETFSSEMQIFNRWGNELYSGGCSWDAEFDTSEEKNDGTYYYIIDASSECKELSSQKKFTGTVHILK